MKAKEILEHLQKFNEEGELTLEKAKEILEKEDLIEDYEVKPIEFKTMYNDYKVFGTDYNAVISSKDFDQFVKDTCNEFAQCLPDKFDRYVNIDAMIEDIQEWPVVLYQAQRFMEEQGREVSSITKITPTYDNCYILELL